MPDAEHGENADAYERLRRVLFRMDPEQAHHLGTLAGQVGQRFAGRLLKNSFAFDHDALEQWIWRMRFTNPIGLAAGFDKNARLTAFAEQLGFGFTEVGSVSALPSKGNPRPRLFRLPADEALVNRMGLNNSGARRIAARLRRRRDSIGLPLGVNIAKTHSPDILGEAAVDDFVESFRRMAPLADYVTLNISCPNTAEGTTFEEPSAFESLITAIMLARREANLSTPILIKLSPPPTARVVFDSMVEDIVSISIAHGVDGFVATNTASDRMGLQTSHEQLEAIGPGGLSGPPIEERSNQLIRYLYARTKGAVPIIGVGGVRSGESAYRKLKAGASLVQLYTALVYQGPGVVRTIKEDLVECIEQAGYRSVRDVIGLDHAEEPDRFTLRPS
ncbi:MAG: quinone-dependent dihydroorotate dehydrogenase [Rhodothermales bacterium]